jgi:hypothetical protein
VKDKRTNLTTYNEPKQNWIFWHLTANNISWLLLSLPCHRKLLQFTTFNKTSLCIHKLAKLLQNLELHDTFTCIVRNH